MNIQVNLLPEAKLQKVRNKARKRRFGAIAGITIGVIGVSSITFILLLGFLLSTYQIAKNEEKSLKAEVAKNMELEESATTLQDNLGVFSRLNSNRTQASKIFTNLFSATPSNVTIESLSIDSLGVVTITGKTGTFADVGTYAKALSEYNLNYKPQQNLDRVAIFEDVQINSVSKDATTSKTSFTMAFKVNQEALKKKGS